MTLSDQVTLSSLNSTMISPTAGVHKSYISLGLLIGGMIAARFGRLSISTNRMLYKCVKSI